MDMAQTIDSLVRHLASLNDHQAAIALTFGVSVVAAVTGLTSLALFLAFTLKMAKLNSMERIAMHKVMASERLAIVKRLARIAEVNAAALNQLSTETRRLSAKMDQTTSRVHDLFQATRFIQDQVVDLGQSQSDGARFPDEQET